MGDELKRRLKMTGSLAPGQEAVLNLMVAAGHIRERLEQVCGEHDITLAQYNVLRILRGNQSEGYARCEIASRMIERAPDVTRLLDRLEKQGLVERDRSSLDRRRSVSRITGQGLGLVERMQPQIAAVDRIVEERLSPHDRSELSRILERLYTRED